MNAMHAMPVTPLLLGPLLASARLGRGRTLLVCCCAAALGLAMGAGDGDLASARFGTEYGVLLLGCAVAPYLARHRTSLEAALAQAREVARSTQQLILRPISRDLAGIHVCTRYHCAAAESAVGGDVYDAAATPYGLRVLVGDVRGHGLEALRLSAATVAAFRELAYTTPDLPALVTDLDKRLAPQLEAEDFVTAVLAEFAPGEVRLVNCGHPAPVRAGRSVELLEPLAPVTPLGLNPDPRQYRVRLQPVTGSCSTPTASPRPVPRTAPPSPSSPRRPARCANRSPTTPSTTSTPASSPTPAPVPPTTWPWCCASRPRRRRR
ncbi:hypothetical protein AS200_30980 [Streptomyces sp. CdTB01]|nr:hypothetical protein AS200_30980 [Streptomyces sp. CdTB01]